MVCGHCSVAVRDAMVSSSVQRSAVPGRGADSASLAGAVVAVGLPAERERLMAAGLPVDVVAAIQSARAPSTRGIYAFKWRKALSPNRCPIAGILTFLQELLEECRSHSTLKVYLAAISACHEGIHGAAPSAHPLAVRFLKGTRRLRTVTKSMVPSWDLVVVLEAMCEPPFEPLEALDLRMLSYKTALLLALASAKRVGDLHALSVHPTCVQFALDGSRVVLRPNAAYTPKVLSGAYSALSFELPALSNLSIDSEEDRKLHALCPVRALRRYIEQTLAVCSTDQLFVCFVGPVRDKPLSKQRISYWIVEAISIADKSKGLSLPAGVHAHSTRGMSASWALFRGVSVEDVCAAASWASPHTFVCFYRLDVTAATVARSVLTAAVSNQGPSLPWEAWGMWRCCSLAFSSATLRGVYICPIVMCCTEWTDWMGTLSYAYNYCSQKEGNEVQHLRAPRSRRLGEELDWKKGMTHATAFICCGQVVPPTSPCVTGLSGMIRGVFSRWRKSAISHSHVLYLISLLLGTVVICITQCLLHSWMNQQFEWMTRKDIYRHLLADLVSYLEYNLI